MTSGESPEALAWLDRAACGLMQTADDGTFLHANSTFCAWVGHPAEALVLRRRFQDLLSMGGRIFHQTHWAPLLRMQGSVSEVKLEILHADGSSIPMVVNAVRHERAGEIVHEMAAFVARDRDMYERELVDSRKRLEILVREATRLQAEAKDRALFAEQMVGIVSHDLRNPLSAIGMGAVVLAAADLPEDQKQILARITRSADRANLLIADLLDFTQARLGKGITISAEAIDLHEAVSDAVEELRLVYPTRALLHDRFGEGRCSADPNRLAQLVGNLVSNAMVYGTPEAPVSVTSVGDGDAFSIAVHNDGAPIPPEAQAALFQPMTRGTPTNAGRSVGLGLFIVREIAKAHGGMTLVESTVATGTTFRAIFRR